MSHLVAQDCRIFLGTHDISGHSNAVDIRGGIKREEATVFGLTQEIFLPGMKTLAIGASGLNDFDDEQAHEALYTRLGLAGQIITIAPSGADGDVAQFCQAHVGEYSPIDAVAIGSPVKWRMGANPEGEVTDGKLLHGKASRAATGNGTGQQLGAVAAGKSLYAALHVFSAPGTSLVVKVQSDDNSGFSSATDRITFTTVTTSIAAQLLSVAGAITDDWWRIVYTITGAGPYVFAVAAGIR